MHICPIGLNLYIIKNTKNNAYILERRKISSQSNNFSTFFIVILVASISERRHVCGRSAF
jgi:hypothetical protein